MNKNKSKRSRKKTIRVLLGVTSAFVLVVLSSISVFAVYVTNRFESEMDLKLFENIAEDTVTRLYYFDKNGNAVELAGERLYGSYITVYTSIDKIPQDLVNAFIAIEDKRYYSHHGVDWIRTASAALNYVTKSKNTFGASTITQQLIKNVTGKDEITLTRKLQEIFYALDLEKKIDKTEILEFYLNIVNLSQGCYGVGAGAEKYFSKSVSELDLVECATLAAITKSPSYYDPLKNPENNRDRRNVILKEMYSQGYISESDYNSAVEKELVLNLSEEKSSVNSWYTDMVVEDIINDLSEQLGYTKAAAAYLVYNGGLQIYTAMDPQVQKAVETYYANQANFPEDDAENGRSGMIIISPDNGDILGVAGAIGEKKANRVQSYATDTLRPSGSAIKPLSVYAPALEEGIITWASVYDDVPVEFQKYGESYITWPNNATLTYRGLSNINYSIRNSLNTTAVRVLYDLGTDTSYEYLYNKLDMKNLVAKDNGIASLALGQQNYGITLRELTAAYSIFANNGVFNSPRSYYMVMTSSGEVLLNNNKNYSERVISEGNAAVMTKMLENVVDYGSVSYTISLRNSVDIAGKTGTTQDTCDRWFVGYTPYYICGVWYGHEYPSTLPDSTKYICSTTWNAVMTSLHESVIESGDVERFTIPDNVITASFCRDSGQLMTGACMIDPRGERSEVGYFVDGTQPKTFCECHIAVAYDADCGGIASYECENAEIVGLIKVEREFPMQIYVTDAQYTWRAILDEIPPCAENSHPYFVYSLKENSYCGISPDVDRQFNSGCPRHYSYAWWAFGGNKHKPREE